MLRGKESFTWYILNNSSLFWIGFCTPLSDRLFITVFDITRNSTILGLSPVCLVVWFYRLVAGMVEKSQSMQLRTLFIDQGLLAFKNCPGSLAGGRSSYQNSTSYKKWKNLKEYKCFGQAVQFEKKRKVPWEPKKWFRIAKFIRMVDLPPSTVKTDLQSLINEPYNFSEQRHLWMKLFSSQSFSISIYNCAHTY